MTRRPDADPGPGSSARRRTGTVGLAAVVLALPTTVSSAALAAPGAATTPTPARTHATAPAPVADITAPAAPTGLRATTVVAQGLLLTFVPPADDPAAPVGGYELSVDGGPFGRVNPTFADGSGSFTLALAPQVGTRYTFRLRAVNAAGPGAAATGALLFTPPAAIDGVQVVPQDRGVALIFGISLPDDALYNTGYVSSLDGGRTWLPLPVNDYPHGLYIGGVTGLKNGTAYSILLSAVNPAGRGTPSGPFVFTPAAVPAAPGLRAVPGDRNVTLVVTPPATDGGSPVTGYLLTSEDGSGPQPLLLTAGPAGTLTATITGLTNGLLYTFQVQAVNRAGVSDAASATFTPGVPVTDPITVKYLALGGATSFLGAAVGAEVTGLPGGGSSQTFERGAIFFSPATGAFSVRGAVLVRYLALNGPAGPLGYPVTDELPLGDRVGRASHFAGSGGSSVYWTPATGAHAVQGAIRAKWASLGWERGPLGYPVTDETAVPGGRRSTFQGGYVVWTAATGRVRVTYTR